MNDVEEDDLVSSNLVSTSIASFFPKAVLTTAPLSPPVTRAVPASQRLQIGEFPCKRFVGVVLVGSSFCQPVLRARPQIVLDGFSASEDTFVFESHLRLLTVEQLAGVRVPDGQPAVLPGRVEEGVGEESSVNPRHVPVHPMPRLHAGSPPVFQAWQPAFDVGEVDRPDDCGAVVAGGADGLG